MLPPRAGTPDAPDCFFVPPPPPRHIACVRVNEVFIGAAPAFVCVVCLLSFLRPGRGTERWQKAVRAGVIGDDDAVQFCSSVSVRRCVLAGGKDTNGVRLGTCSACYYKNPPAAIRKGCPNPCQPLVHKPGSSPRTAAASPGPACLTFLWNPDKADVQRQLPPRQRDKVCKGCKSRAERASRSAPPTASAAPPPAPPSPRRQVSLTSVSVSPAVAPAPHHFSMVTGPSLTIEPDSDTIKGLIDAHVEKTKPEEIRVTFVKGARRIYRRIIIPRKAVVGERQDRRRRADAIAQVSTTLCVKPADIASVMVPILRRAQSQGASIAPFHSLSVREQTRFKVAKRISGVTWACGSIDPQVGGQHVPCKGRQATSLIRSSPCIWVHIL
ncbi:hypothetical protein I4F81_005574 [Pyropia yezoensis]|uniref:Uncharacterized protein n=1 Tax=Pyropia yezoensis TaxID=2788 RepID=A0ACC3BYL7_PYRYE|nr:hypothetical protein I4F81_005574 [Neopyropia yezoensis]